MDGWAAPQWLTAAAEPRRSCSIIVWGCSGSLRAPVSAGKKEQQNGKKKGTTTLGSQDESRLYSHFQKANAKDHFVATNNIISCGFIQKLKAHKQIGTPTDQDSMMLRRVPHPPFPSYPRPYGSMSMGTGRCVDGRVMIDSHCIYSRLQRSRVNKGWGESWWKGGTMLPSHLLTANGCKRIKELLSVSVDDGRNHAGGGESRDVHAHSLES